MKKTFIGRICSVALSMTVAATSFSAAMPLTAVAAEDFEDFEELEDFEDFEDEVGFEDDLWESDEDFFEDETEDTIKEKSEKETKDEFEEDESLAEDETEIELELPDQSGYRENSFRYQNGERIQGDALFYSESGDYEYEWTYDGKGWLNSIGKYIPGARQKGVDVSYAQGIIDWNKVKNSDVSWAIIRCGYGNNQSDQDDAQWARNVSECERLGIPYGVYIYSYATNVQEARSEAEHVLRLVKGKNLSMPIYYDLEDERTTGKCSNAEIAEMAKTFCNVIESNGYEVGIYASKSWFTSKLTASCFNSWPKWVAQYYSECTYAGSYVIWQCTGEGVVDGINHAVDLNFSYYDVSGGSAPKPTVPDDPKPVDPSTSDEKLTNFVRRLYSIVLGRQPEQSGLDYWVAKLKRGDVTGAKVAYDFFNSKEYLNKNTSNTTYIRDLYNTFFDRKPEASGQNYWMGKLAEGQSRAYVLKGFAESTEFTRICNQYGITRGTITIKDNSKEIALIQQYIARNYKQFLGRTPDASGLSYWTNKLISKSMTPAQVAKNFVFSSEFKSKNYTNEQFILKLYLGLFGRDADANGFTEWRKKMSAGMSREQVFENFIKSSEFKKMVAQFGL